MQNSTTETIVVDLGTANGQVTVNIVRKNISHLYLRVNRDMKITLSAPIRAPKSWIKRFIDEHLDWIDNQVTRCKQMTGSVSDILGDESALVLGLKYRVEKVPAAVNRVEVNGDVIRIYLKGGVEEDAAQKVFAKWWRAMATDIYQTELDAMFDAIFAPLGLRRPALTVRKMKTLWGSCTPSKSKIALNEYLLKADIDCIRYVVLHELSHLIYPNHSADFYAFVSRYMPDWKARKKRLAAILRSRP